MPAAGPPDSPQPAEEPCRPNSSRSAEQANIISMGLAKQLPAPAMQPAAGSQTRAIASLQAVSEPRPDNAVPVPIATASAAAAQQPTEPTTAPQERHQTPGPSAAALQAGSSMAFAEADIELLADSPVVSARHQSSPSSSSDLQLESFLGAAPAAATASGPSAAAASAPAAAVESSRARPAAAAHMPAALPREQQPAVRESVALDSDSDHDNEAEEPLWEPEPEPASRQLAGYALSSRHAVGICTASAQKIHICFLLHMNTRQQNCICTELQSFSHIHPLNRNDISNTFSICAPSISLVCSPFDSDGDSTLLCSARGRAKTAEEKAAAAAAKELEKQQKKEARERARQEKAAHKRAPSAV